MDEMELVSERCDALLKEYDETISGLEASLRQMQEKRESVAITRDEAQSVLASLRSVRERAESLQLLETPDSSAPQWLAPDEDDHTQTPTPEPPVPPTPAKAVIVRGPRMKEILSVLGADPDRAWGTRDIAALLGIADNAKASRKALRANLRSLTARGVLERITVEGDSHTYYRPLMNWSFI
ncbi:hypothetical protein ABCR94_03615 [Streptomyces sp. 21So2-11]|uniref:hypothetical protein n=1 Tax=Streptomyces sp. 21So2-11 TaxID=3144408 RepID=UPI00321AE93E